MTGRGRLREGVAAVVVSVLVAAIFLAFCELTLRIYVNRTAGARRGRALPTPSQRHDYQIADPVVGYVLKPGYDADGIHVNSLGFRGPEIALDKPGDVFRVVAIGDSTTFGLEGEECTYPAQLQKKLNETRRAKRVEVVNAGVEGYSSTYALSLLRHRVASLHPDVVLIYVGWNDLYGIDPRHPPEESVAEDLDLESLPQEACGIKAQIGRYLQVLYLSQFMTRLTHLELPRLMAKLRTPSDSTMQISRLATYGFERRLVAIVHSSREGGAVPVLMSLPTILSERMSAKALSVVHYPGWANGDVGYLLAVAKEYNAALRRVAQSESVQLIDNAPYVDSRQDKDMLFFDTLHMYCQGYELLARNIAKVLDEKKLVPAPTQDASGRN
jgi:lysophospholipase L1-like esterase